MRKIILSSFFIIAGCGSSLPEVSDIEKGLAKDLLECSYIDIYDVKKINGMEGDSNNEYIVEQEYSVRFKPSKAQLSIIKDAEIFKEKYKEHTPIFDKMTEEIKVLSNKYERISMQSFSSQEEFQRARQEIFDQQKNLEKERDKVARDLGFSSYYDSRSPTDHLNMTYVLKIDREFYDKCPKLKMTKNGQNIINNLFSEGYIKAFSGEASVKLTQKRVYRKTENGWIPYS